MRNVYTILLAMIIATTAFLSTIPSQKAHACSGMPATIDRLSERSDVIARVTAIEKDDLGQNTIVRVQHYIKGEDVPEEILIRYNPHDITMGLLAGMYGGGDCNYIVNGLDVNQSAYVFLRQQSDGTYSSVAGLFEPMFYQFPMSVYIGSEQVNGEDEEEVAFTEQDFIAHVTDLLQTELKVPDTSSNYPLKAPLEITLADGSFWRVNVDYTTEAIFSHPSETSQDNQGCVIEGCRVEQWYGYMSVQIQEEGIYFAQGYYGDYLDGIAFSLPPLGMHIAVWESERLVIYQHDGFEGIPVVGIHPLEEQDQPNGFGLWSHDGQIFAFSNDRGLWLWKVFEWDAPELYLPAEGNRITVNNWSPNDRFISINIDDLVNNLDITSGNIIGQDVTFSPNSEYYLNNNNGAGALTLCNLFGECQELIETSDFGWLSVDSFYAIGQVDGERMINFYALNDGQTELIRQEIGYALAYDDRNDSLALVIGENAVEVDGVVLDLPRFSVPIQSIDWGASKFLNITVDECTYLDLDYFGSENICDEIEE